MIENNSTFVYPFFTEAQNNAYIKLLDFIDSPYNQNDFKRALSGYGGTGKSFLLKYLITDCHIPKSRIKIAAPTHKACRILRESVEESLDAENINTIHSDLGLQPNYDLENFKEDDLKFTMQGKLKIKECDLYIIDEASMVNSNLLNTIYKLAKQFKIKIILSGDKDQLCPVGEYNIPAFSDIQTVELNQIVRQKEDSPILPCLRMLREDIENHTTRFIDIIDSLRGKEEYNNSGGYSILNTQDFSEKITESFKDMCNPGDIKVLAFTNKTVSFWNNFIRNTVLEKDYTNPISLGELVTSYTTILNKKMNPIINKSEDYIIASLLKCIHPSYFIPVLQVRFKTFDGELTTPIYILDSTNKKALEDYTEYRYKLFAKAVKTSDKDERKAAWRKYFIFKDSMLLYSDISSIEHNITFNKTIDYGYALTAHKSQGSTYNEVFVDAEDIIYSDVLQRYKNIDEINRRLYVAISRTKNKVYIKI